LPGAERVRPRRNTRIETNHSIWRSKHLLWFLQRRTVLEVHIKRHGLRVIPCLIFASPRAVGYHVARASPIGLRCSPHASQVSSAQWSPALNGCGRQRNNQDRGSTRPTLALTRWGCRTVDRESSPRCLSARPRLWCARRSPSTACERWTWRSRCGFRISAP
jgi:hypothetical protein